MKKYISLVLLTVLLLGALAACGATPAETTPVAPTPTTPAPTTPAPTTPAPTTPAPTTPVVTTPTPTTPVVTPAPAPTYPPIGESPYTTVQLYAWGIRPVGSFACEDGFLGVYNDYAVYTCRSSIPGGSKIKAIGNIKYWVGEAYAVACKDGDVYSLASALGHHILTNEDLEAITHYWYGGKAAEDYEAPIFHETNVILPESPYPPLGVSPYTSDQLKAWEIFPEGSHRCLDGYLGTYNGYAVYAECGNIRSFEYKMIGEVCFEWGELFATACKNGETYLLDEAFALGLLDNDDLRAIAYYWYGDTFPEL